MSRNESSLAEQKTATREDVEQAYASDRDLRSLNLRDGAYDQIVLTDAILNGADLRRTNFQEADLNRAQLQGVEAVRTTFTKANLAGADLINSDLKGAQFNSADLRGADVRGCSFSPDTNFRGAKVTGMKIDRQGLRMLGAERGGLTDGDLSGMTVHDDLVKLVTGFGGFWTVLHLLAVTIFFTPYIAFVAWRYAEAQLAPCLTNCVALRKSLWEHVSTNSAGAADWLGLCIFILLLLYNIFRVSLVYKAQALRLAESASGINREFKLRGWWWLAYHGCQLLVWVNLILVAWHAYGFLDTPVNP